MLDKDQEDWPNCIAVTKIAINFTMNVNIQKPSFKVLYDENILLLIDLLLSREFSINLQAYKSASKITKSQLTRSKVLYIMLYKLKNNFITANIKPSLLILVI